MSRVLTIASVLALTCSAAGQSANIHLPYPPGLPWDALRPASSSNSDGYPVWNPNNWPVSANLGYLDGDDDIDVLYCVEQRLILAVSFQRDQQGHPIAPVPLWAVFDPLGDINKSFWGLDHAAVWDVDGDGKDESIYLALGASGNFHLNVIDDDPLLCTVACPNQLGTLPVPAIAASFEIDSVQAGWSFRARSNGSSSPNANTRVTIANVRGLPSARDIVVYQTQSNEAQVFDFNPSVGLTHLFSMPYRGQATHAPHYFDVTGDGREECLDNGAYDFHGCPSVYCAYDIASGQSGYCGTHPYDHADGIQPIGDVDSDGFPDMFVVDDGFSKIMAGGPQIGCTPGSPVIISESQLLAHHADSHTTGNPFPSHGQTVSIGRYVAGTDFCGGTGLQVLCTPKGDPYKNGTGDWGNFLANDQMTILASSVKTTNGPTGWLPRNIDWDGNRTTDETFNTIGGTHQVYELVPSGGLDCGAGSVVDPMIGPWVHPYRWSFLLATNSPSGHFDSMMHNHAVDFFGDARDELVIPGAGGLFVVYNPDQNPNAGLHPPSFQVESYRRRFVSSLNRYIDYQDLPTLTSVEVRPATSGLSTSGSTAYSAIGHYDNGMTADVTAFATWTSGDPSVAGFNGNTLFANADGVTTVRATVAGMNNNDAALAMVSNSLKPRILHAGWADTYLQAGQPGDLTFEVRVADAQNDVVQVVAAFNNVILPAIVFVDDGTASDQVADDGTWTARLSGILLTSPLEFYLEAMAVDSGNRLSKVWPYVTAGNPGQAAPVPGFSVFPFASELFGSGPLVAGVGVLSDPVIQSNGGTIDVVARVTDPGITTLFTFIGGINLGTGMNDLGLGADQLAGDGLWTMSVTVPPNPPTGRYVIDHIAIDTNVSISDAFPRLRIHQ